MKKIIPFTKDIPFDTMISEITDIEVTHDLKVADNNTVDGSFLVNGTYKMTDASQIEENFNYNLPFTIDVDDKYDLSNCKIKINDFYFEIINEDVLKINIELEIADVTEKEIDVPTRCYDNEETKKNADESDNDSINDAKILNDFDEIVDSLELDTNIIPDSDSSNNILNSNVAEQKETIVNNSNDSQNTVPNITKNDMMIKTNKNMNANLNISSIFSSISNDEDTYKSYYVYIVRENDTVDDILAKYKVTKEDLSLYNNIDDIKIGCKLIIPSPNE